MSLVYLTSPVLFPSVPSSFYCPLKHCSVTSKFVTSIVLCSTFNPSPSLLQAKQPLLLFPFHSHCCRQCTSPYFYLASLHFILHTHTFRRRFSVSFCITDPRLLLLAGCIYVPYYRRALLLHTHTLLYPFTFQCTCASNDFI